MSGVIEKLKSITRKDWGGEMMSTWLYIAAGIGAFIVFVLMFVLMTLADDWDSVNGTENNAPVTYDEECNGVGDEL